MKRSGVSYPSKAIIQRMLSAARDAGIEAPGFDVFPDGRIRVLSGSVLKAEQNAFDRFERQL